LSRGGARAAKEASRGEEQPTAKHAEITACAAVAFGGAHVPAFEPRQTIRGGFLPGGCGVK